MISTPAQTPSRGLHVSPQSGTPPTVTPMTLSAQFASVLPGSSSIQATHRQGLLTSHALSPAHLGDGGFTGGSAVVSAGAFSSAGSGAMQTPGQSMSFEANHQPASAERSNSYIPPPPTMVQYSDFQTHDPEDRRSFIPPVATTMPQPQRSWISAPVRPVLTSGAPPPVPARVLPSPGSQTSPGHGSILSSATAVSASEMPMPASVQFQSNPAGIAQAVYAQIPSVQVDVEVLPHMLHSEGVPTTYGEAPAFAEVMPPRRVVPFARSLPVRQVASFVAPPPPQQPPQPPMQQPSQTRHLQPQVVVPTVVPTIAGVEHFEPEVVWELLRSDEKCVLVDLRGEDRAAGLIEGAVHVPAMGSVAFVTKVPDLVRAYGDQSFVIFTCQYSVHRAPQCANWYREKANPQQRVGILSGGFRGWEARGLPVVSPADGKLKGSMADHFAMQQGLRFVQQHAPQVYERAERQNKPQLEELLQPLRQATKTVTQAQAQAHTQAQMQQAQAQHAQPQPQPHSQRQVRVHARKYQPPHLPNTVPTKAGVEHLDPGTVHELLQDRKCVLVDLRGEDRAAGLIEGAVPVPAIGHIPFIAKVPTLVKKFVKDDLVVFTCQYSAHRAPQCANWYREKANSQQRVAILSGGFRGWEAEGLPVVPCTGSALDTSAADEFAMSQGVSFVKQYAPKIYQQAQQRQRQQQQQQQDDAHSADHSIASKEEPSSRSQHESSSRSQQHSLPATEKVQLRSQQSQARSRAPSEGAPYFTHTHGSHFERSPERDHGSEMGERAHREPPPPPSRTVGRSSGHAGRGVSQDVSGRHTRSNQQSHGQSRRHQLESQSRSHARADRSQTPTHGGLAKRQGQAQTQAHPQAQTRSRTPTKASAPPQSEVAPQSPHAPPHLPSSVAPPPPHATPHLPNTVPTIAGVEHLEPEEVFEMMWSKECTLVDVRGEDRSAGLIEGALHVPAIDKVMFPSKVPELVHRFKSESLVVFTCQYSAHRAPQCANWYREQAEPKQRVAILVGGFRGWEAQGFPVNQAAVTAEQAASADKFAMRQGVGFVKRYAPEVYQQARQLQQKQKELQHQLQKQQQQLQKQQQHHEQQLQKQQQQQEQKLQQQQREQQREQLQKELQKQQQQREQQKQQQQQEQHQHQLQQQQLLQQQQQILQQQQQQQQMQQQQLQQQHHQLQQQQQQQQQQHAQPHPQPQQVLHEQPAHSQASSQQSTQQPLHELQPQQLQEVLREQHAHSQAAQQPQQLQEARAEDKQKPRRQVLPNTVPTQNDVEHLEPEEVLDLLQTQACVLVDVRGDDRAAGLIEGAMHVPAIGEPMFPAKVPELVKTLADQPLVIFTCQYSAHRAPQCANWYREQASHEQRVAVLAGGFRGWEAAGLPVLSAANPNEATAADEFAMEQGTNFVREFAPHILQQGPM